MIATRTPRGGDRRPSARRLGLLATGIALVLGVLAGPALAADPEYRRDIRNARNYLARGQYEAAARTYQSILEKHPIDEQASVGYASALIGLEDYETAATFLDAALETVPVKTNLYRKRSELNRARGRPAEAFRDALQVMVENDGLAPWVFRETRELLEEGLEPARAREAAEEALERNPDDLNFALLGGIVLALDDEGDRAIDLIGEADDRTRQGGRFLLRFADEMLNLGRREYGLRVLMAAADLADKPAHRSDIRFRAARLLEEEERYPEALEQLRLVATEREGTAAAGKALLESAEIQQEHLDDPVAALAIYESLENDPSLGRYRPRMFLQMGDCYVRLGNFERAADVLRKVLPEAIDPEEAEAASYRLAEVEFYRGDADSALTLYQDMAETFSRSLLTDDAADRYILLNTYASLGGGEALGIFGRMEWARSVGDSAAVDSTASLLLDRYPGGELAAEAWMALAGLALDHGRPELALERLGRVVDEHAGDRRAPRALRRQGDVLMELGRPAEALDRYERLLIDYPESVLAGEVRRQVETLRRDIKS